jgi:hypothetical protein
MKPKIFYRVANIETNQGLWYDFEGNFTGLIHDKFNFCLNTDLPMPYDKDIVGWLSATDEIDSLWAWFPKEDIVKLEEHGYYISVFEATDYKFHNNHWIIKQDTSTPMFQIELSKIDELDNMVKDILRWVI